MSKLVNHAQSLLESMGIKVIGIEYVPSEFSDLVRDIKFNGQTLTPGQKIPAGSGVVLVVGRTSTDEDGSQLMPDVQSLSLDQATKLINSHMPNPKRLRDWLSIPKSNGYESLHITVMGPDGKWVEVQIRTRRMDEIAEKGVAAHWKYKGIKSESSGMSK